MSIESTDGLQELMGDFQPGTVERLQDAVLTLSEEKQQAVRERDEARQQLRGAVDRADIAERALRTLCADVWPGCDVNAAASRYLAVAGTGGR